MTLVFFNRYYFDGQGKAIRPVIAMTLAHAFNQDFQKRGDLEERKLEALLWKQRRGAIISEMIHTASLVHDDVLDKVCKSNEAFSFERPVSKHVFKYVFKIDEFSVKPNPNSRRFGTN